MGVKFIPFVHNIFVILLLMFSLLLSFLVVSSIVDFSPVLGQGNPQGCKYDRSKDHLDRNYKVSRHSTYYWTHQFIGTIDTLSNFDRCCICCNGGNTTGVVGYGLRFYLECQCGQHTLTDCPQVVQPAATSQTVQTKVTDATIKTTTVISRPTATSETVPTTVTAAPTTPSYISQLEICRKPPGDSCDWYRTCLHRFNPCPTNSSDEYALNYGYKYCEKYEQNIEKFSQQATQWISKVKTCLQNELKYCVGDKTYSCLDLQVNAFNSHTKCYVESGFCELPIADYVQITKVVGNALIPFSGGSWNTAKNGASTLVSCSQRYASALGSKFISVVNELNYFSSTLNGIVG